MLRSSLKWFGGISFSAEKRNFLDWGDVLYQTVNYNKLVVITTDVNYGKILIAMYTYTHTHTYIYIYGSRFLMYLRVIFHIAVYNLRLL
jgi:hypothetical protein